MKIFNDWKKDLARIACTVVKLCLRISRTLIGLTNFWKKILLKFRQIKCYLFKRWEWTLLAKISGRKFKIDKISSKVKSTVNLSLDLKLFRLYTEKTNQCVSLTSVTLSVPYNWLWNLITGRASSLLFSRFMLWWLAVSVKRITRQPRYDCPLWWSVKNLTFLIQTSSWALCCTG